MVCVAQSSSSVVVSVSVSVSVLSGLVGATYTLVQAAVGTGVVFITGSPDALMHSD